MRNARTRTLTWIIGLLFGLALGSGRADADPVGFAVNQDSNSVSVVDLTTRTTRATIGTLMAGPNDPGAAPGDVVVDPQSGWVYAASNFRLIAFNGRLAVSTPSVVAVPARDKGTGLAIDVAGRRIFMCHGDLPGLDYGIVSEFSIANPAQPVLIAEHIAERTFGVPATDLRYIAWDPLHLQLYVASSDGVVYVTDAGTMNFVDYSTRIPTPGGILADPVGGVWVSSRATGDGRLFRFRPGVTNTSYAIGNNNPRGMAWDTTIPGTIVVAIDTQNVIRRFRPGTGTYDAVDVMLTDANPQDVGVTAAGAVVSLNRRVGAAAGNVTVAGVSQPVDTTGERSVALAVTEIAKLTATPASHSYCWNRHGDVRTKLFTVQNTRLDRLAVTLSPVVMAGSNPGQYVVGKNTCASKALKFGATCQFSVQFTASGGCVQPPPPFPGTLPICYWPAEVVIASSNGSATTRIPVRGSVALNPCPP